MAGRGTQHASNILGELESAKRPLSAYDLLDRLRPTGVAAPLTVYRALDKLIKAGQVHRIESLNAFVACSADGGHDHGHDASAHDKNVVFALCDLCGKVEEFADPSLTGAIERKLGTRGFTVESSTIEIHGKCEACR